MRRGKMIPLPYEKAHTGIISYVLENASSLRYRALQVTIFPLCPLKCLSHISPHFPQDSRFIPHDFRLNPIAYCVLICVDPP